ncbi:MAG TPA: NAD-dependent epimerase/dehydratase family protein [Aggregatilineaceae bacterium]|nr:NAD-dependent epimerase/dehydratase family protein [Aggregatilineaceae bacterium]
MSNGIVLVTGATGAVGPTLVNHLLHQGYEVRSYGLDEPAPGLFAEQIEHITGDINDETRLARGLNGIDIVFHLAALLHIENPAPELAPEYWHVNVNGSRLAAEQAVLANVRRFVYFSTVKVYGISQREPVTEDAPTSPESTYAQTKWAGEEAVRTIEGLETCVLRLSAVFGPRLKGSWNRLVRTIARGYFVPIGNLQNAHSLTYVDDVAQAALIAAEASDAAGQVYNVVGYENPRLQDILESIYSALSHTAPSYRIPSGIALLGSFVLEQGFKLLGKQAPLTSNAVHQLTDDEVYSGAKLRQLGFAPSLTLEQSWQRTIDQRQK